MTLTFRELSFPSFPREMRGRVKLRKPSEIVLCLSPFAHHQDDRGSHVIKAMGIAGEFRRGHWKGWVEKIG